MRIIRSTSFRSILIFTLTTTCSILLCMYAFVFQPQKISSYVGYQVVDSTDLMQKTQISTVLQGRSILTSSEMDSLYSQQFTRNFSFLFVSILLIMTISSLFLWFWMRYQERKRHLRIAKTIAQAQNKELKQGEEFYQELEQIISIIDHYQEDQHRLHAYIMHEQKNMIMLIKARLNKHDDPQLYIDIDHLKYSVDDVLTLFANTESERERIDLAYIVAWECDQYRQMYPNLSFSFDEEKAYTMLGKAYWLHRAVANLLDNAIKYGNNQPIEVKLRQKHETILLQVIDHGIGMNKQQIDHIFQYRYRIQDLKKDGYGIGLSLVAHTCELCDGVIIVKSTPQQGSVFHLSFPLNIG